MPRTGRPAGIVDCRDCRDYQCWDATSTSGAAAASTVLVNGRRFDEDDSEGTRKRLCWLEYTVSVSLYNIFLLLQSVLPISISRSKICRTLLYFL
jgi:hypothetical protein